MKKFFFLFVLVGVYSYSDLSSQTLPSEELCTWQERLEYAKSYNHETKSGKDLPCIVSYRHKGTIGEKDDISGIVESMFSEDSYFVLYKDFGFAGLEILPICTMLQKLCVPDGHDPFKDLKSQLKEEVKAGMEMVEIEWSYRGESFLSMAIVSNEKGGFIYDNIGTYVISETTGTCFSCDESLPPFNLRSESGTDRVRRFNP